MIATLTISLAGALVLSAFAICLSIYVDNDMKQAKKTRVNAKWFDND